MIKIFVKPAPRIKVRTEDGRRHIAEAGEAVANTTYIGRRLRAGDLATCDQDAGGLAIEAGPADPEPDAPQDAAKPRGRRASRKEA